MTSTAAAHSSPSLPWWQQWSWLWALCFVLWWVAFQIPDVVLHISGAWGAGTGEVLKAVAGSDWGFRFIFAVPPFVPLALALLAAFAFIRKSPPMLRPWAFLIPTLAYGGLYVAEGLQTSRQEFAGQFGRPVPAGASNYRGWHVSGGGLQSAVGGVVAVYRMEVPPSELAALLQEEKAVPLDKEDEKHRSEWEYLVLRAAERGVPLPSEEGHAVVRLSHNEEMPQASHRYVLTRTGSNEVFWAAQAFPK